MTLKVFCSLSSRDLQAVLPLREQLRVLGIDLYFAVFDPQPGVRISAKIRKAINDCDVVLVLLTSDGVSSIWVQNEIGGALQADKRVIALAWPEAIVDLGILGDIEQIRVDRANPSLAWTQVVATLVSTRDKRQQHLAAEAQAERRQHALALALIILLLVMMLTIG